MSERRCTKKTQKNVVKGAAEFVIIPTKLMKEQQQQKQQQQNMNK